MVQRPSEPFHRIYSTPEPPSQIRVPRLLKPVAVVAALAAAGAIGFLVVPGAGRGGGGEDAAALGHLHGDRREPQSSAVPMVTVLPSPCATVSKATVGRAVPKAKRRQDGNSTLTTCTYSEGSRWLRVEARLYAPDNTATPVEDAERRYEERWAEAQSTPLDRTIRLEPHRGVGDEAYRWFRMDGGPDVVGEVTARTRNAILTVSYGERVPDDGERYEREHACLDRAAAVAREVVTALNRF
ncbi:MAG: hypothetical protein FWJ90_21565 [Actinomadura sp.]